MKIKYLFYLLTFIGLFSSCETSNSFLSESEVKKRLVGSWTVVIPYDPSSSVKWVFDGSNLNVFRNNVLEADEKPYSVSSNYLTPKIHIEGNSFIGGDSDIIEITKSKLVLTHRNVGTNAINQYELTK